VSVLLEIRAAMSAQADPERAKAQQAYMKSTMPFHGVTMPEVRTISRRAFAAHDGVGCDRWREEVLGIWRAATYREERYAAVMLAGDGATRHAARQGRCPCSRRWW